MGDPFQDRSLLGKQDCSRPRTVGSIIASSADGVSWVRSPVNVNGILADVAWCEKLRLWVVVGIDGQIFSSANGVSWTRQASPTNHHWRAICSDGNQFVAVGNA